MPPIFTKLLAERLDSNSQLTIVEARHDQEVKGGTVYLAPGGFHMQVKRRFGRTFIALNEEAPENSCRPAVDSLFRSVAEVYGASTLGVMLTGMGQDGLKGCETLKACGATILAQNRESSAVWGMPGAVVEAGLAKASLPISEIARYISASGVAGARLSTPSNAHA
jgi:two-component system chemotaxis response regulator CheB